MGANIQNIKFVFEAQFMTKLNNTEAELKNSVAYKKAFILSRTFKFTVSRLKE